MSAHILRLCVQQNLYLKNYIAMCVLYNVNIIIMYFALYVNASNFDQVNFIYVHKCKTLLNIFFLTFQFQRSLLKPNFSFSIGMNRNIYIYICIK